MDAKRGLVLVLFLFTGCALQVTPATIKIALVAPFEGRFREVGYDALFAARLALSEADARHIALLAVDDGGSPQTAAERMAALAIDPAVEAIIALGTSATSTNAQQAQSTVPVLIVGYWQTPPQAAHVLMLAHPEITQEVTYTAPTLPEALPPTIVIAGDIFALNQVPLRYDDLSDVTILSSSSLPDDTFRERYATSAPFAPQPSLLTTLTTDAIKLSVTALQSGMSLAEMTYDGINGQITFDGLYWRDAPLQRYRFDEGQLVTTGS